MIFSYLLNMQSHPSWVCGLKHDALCNVLKVCRVTPFVGVWIETLNFAHQRKKVPVTPFVGVWIETLKFRYHQITTKVTPFVGVWIETYNLFIRNNINYVTPFVGVWIETLRMALNWKSYLSHTLRGGVD